MRMFILGLIGVSLSSTASPALAQEATAEAPAGGRMAVANQYLCQFDSSVSKAAVRNEAGKAIGPELGRLLFVYENTIRGFAVRLPASPSSKSAVARLRANNPKISRCTPDGVVRADGGPAGRPGGGGGSGQSTPWGVSRVGGPGDGSALANRAFVIDSGVDLTHPDLNVDLTDAYDFIDSDNQPQDGYGHGTHVAGIIGALNNGIGVVGVAAGVRIVPIRVLDNTGYGADSGVTAAIDYVAAHSIPGDVINLSLVADNVDPVMDSAVAAAAGPDHGLFVVIAAGNNSAPASNYSPGRVNQAGVYTVSSFGSRDTWSRFSNYGNPPIDYAEPGENINSTYKNGGYATLSGTSMAAPHLAGILLLKGSAPSGGGTVKRDPDGQPDTIGVR
jgi:subtilisin family serine protease